ncbi:response regulator transcription factor [Stenotrophomonas sp. 24(2023)]|uniref:response regulator transcription factor n=1 Tax=Stenotrophomonas sp. 24(2023) TaxID=3068324 RepID=UPI0027E0D3E8|nr:response regulator transcription factor [Stenotrophomonas sp. 24(2023)]WMJ71385.1 response regulator transcription factor [Stenotrophomonas sp. 24(2023)]
MQPRIIIADDHPVVLHGVRIVLERQQMQVVASAGDGPALLSLLAQCDPGDYDVLLTDLSMPGDGPDGAQLLQAVRTRHPALPVVVLTGVRHPDVLGGLLREGVLGLVDKTADFIELPQALRAAMAGQLHVSRGLRAHLQARDLHPRREPASLSARECEVLDLLAQGLSINAIADHCGRSPKTISRQKSEAKRKLGLCNNQELFDYLRGRGR